MGLPVSSEGNASDGCFVPLQTLTTSCCNLCNLNGGAIAKAADPACEFGHDTVRVAAAAKPRLAAILRSLVVRRCHAPSSSSPEPSLLPWSSRPVRAVGGKEAYAPRPSVAVRAT